MPGKADGPAETSTPLPGKATVETNVWEVFNAVVELEGPARAAALSALTSGNETLRRDVEDLLAHDASPLSILPSSGDAVPPHLVVAGPDGEPLPGPQPASIIAPGEDDPQSLIGLQIGSYRVLKLIGEGGVAWVYRAMQVQPRRVVALKVVRPGMSSATVRRRLTIEAEILGQLHHRGIAQVYEASTFESNGVRCPFFAMEYVEGLPLTEFVAVRRLPFDARLRLLIELCSAVDLAHQRGVVHRDLKPDNILVRPDGQLKVLDFGVACISEKDLRLSTMHTEVGQLIGTAPYMSPEQAAGDPAEIDLRSDVYSLGVILFEVLTGCLPMPVEGKMLHEVLRMIREDQPMRLSAASPGCRGDIETIVSRALMKDKSDRYRSAADLAHDLRCCLENKPILARPESAWRRTRRLYGRHRIALAGVGAAVVALVVGSTLSAIGLREAARQRVLAEQRLASSLVREQETRLAQLETEEVTNFFSGVISTVRREELGEDVKVVDVLDRAAPRIQETLRERPLLLARLQATIGRTYRRLGRRDVARDFLIRAIAGARICGNAPLEYSSLQELARCALAEGKWSHARDVLELARTVKENHRFLTPNEIGDDMAYVEALFRSGDPARAMSTLQKAIKDTQEARRVASVKIHPLQLEQAGWLMSMGHAREACDLLIPLEQSLRGGALHGRAVLTLLAAYENLDMLADGLALARHCSEAGDSLGVGQTQIFTELAIFCQRAGLMEDAEAHFRTALAFQIGLNSGEAAKTLVAANNLANHLSLMDRDEEAIEIYESSLGAVQDLEHAHRDYSFVLLNYSMLQLRRGAPGAVDVLKANLAYASSRIMGTHILGKAEWRLQVFLREAQQFEEAMEWAAKAVHDAKAWIDHYRVNYVLRLESYARAAVECGYIHEACDAIEEAYELMDHPSVSPHNRHLVRTVRSRIYRSVNGAPPPPDS